MNKEDKKDIEAELVQFDWPEPSTALKARIMSVTQRPQQHLSFFIRFYQWPFKVHIALVATGLVLGTVLGAGINYYDKKNYSYQIASLYGGASATLSQQFLLLERGK
jgi:hypothetical protein